MLEESLMFGIIIEFLVECVWVFISRLVPFILFDRLFDKIGDFISYVWKSMCSRIGFFLFASRHEKDGRKNNDDGE